MSERRYPRVGFKKSRLGCKTCKIRKIKCDETRPNCQRCSSTGRRCDGYDPTSINVDVAIPATLSHLPDALEFERKFFYNYLYRIGPSLSGPLDADFWQVIIPQLCRVEPVIWDTVIAISSIVEHRRWNEHLLTGSSKKPIPVDRQHQRALALYGRAMSRFAGYTADQTPSLAIAIITSILFICIEILEDDIQRAMTLLQRSQSLLNAFNRDLNLSQNINEMALLTKTKAAPLLIGLSVVAAFTGTAPNMILPTEPEAERDLGFSTLAEARDALYTLVLNGYQLLRRVSESKQKPNEGSGVSEDLSEQQRNSISRLHQWYAAFQTINKHDAASSLDTYIVSLLLAHYHVSIIFVSTMLSPYETAYDHFDDLFGKIVQHAKTIVFFSALDTHKVNPPALSTFKLDLGILPTLSFVAIRCRQREIRREAVALLWKCSHEGGAWKALSVAKLSQKILDLEEDAGVRTLSPLRWQVSSTSLPPSHYDDPGLSLDTAAEESRRVHGVHPYQSHESPVEWHIKYTTLCQDHEGGWQTLVHTCPLEGY